MTKRALVLTLLVGISTAIPARAQEPPFDSASSIDRVRAALARPSSLRLTPPERPTFTLRIVERRPLQEIFDTVPWATPPVAWFPPPMITRTMFGTPVASINFLPLLQSAVGGIAAARRRGAERAAAIEVGQAIAAYCAAQPDAGAGIQICSTSPASR